MTESKPTNPSAEIARLYNKFFDADPLHEISAIAVGIEAIRMLPLDARTRVLEYVNSWAHDEANRALPESPPVQEGEI